MKKKMSHRFLFSFFIWLAVCPLWGQANFGIEGHLENERLLLQLDSALLDVPILFVRHGSGQHQVVWSRERNHILLTLPRIRSELGFYLPIYDNYAIKFHVLGRFPILKERSDERSVFIDATELFLQTPIKWGFGDPETVFLDQSYISEVAYLDNETIIRTKRTTAFQNSRRTRAVDFSFYKLPDPMMPRLFDHRMAFAYEDQYDKLNGQVKTENGSITRWRLEKSDGGAAISDPIKPIVLYFDPKTPDKWKPYIKAGVLEWLPPFEKAGFSNAIEVRELPKDKGEHVENSVNYSMVRWSKFVEVRGGQIRGGSSVRKIIDKRTGEILKADILLANPFPGLTDDYIVRCAPLDPRARQYPLPDDLKGKLIQYVTAHEMGHILGIRDANFGEFAYPLERMWDAEWLETMGHTPSVMSYCRHNHVAQPEDNIPPDLLIQKVGPMDAFQIQWGYQQIPKAGSPEAEKPYLDTIVARQDSLPWLRYNIGTFETLGPGSVNQVVGNDDPVKSTELSLKNLKRVLELLPALNKDQRDDELLERLYDRSLELWYHQMFHVLSMIGGYEIQYKKGSQKGLVYDPIPMADQEEAMDFLLQNALDTPDWLSNPSFLPRIRYSMSTDKLLEYQVKLLTELANPLRIKRLEQMERIGSHEGITQRLLLTLGQHLFKDLKGMDRKAQELQWAYISVLSKAVQKNNLDVGVDYRIDGYGYSSYVKSIFHMQGKSIYKRLGKGLGENIDPIIKAHLQRCLKELDGVAMENRSR
ncbi:MAG: zinc-dependent metalloprotease [Flavobacteriaceae bacterium]|nr:zinc-dependent metalloprotease [Flavobacteriaceae bacterium]